ncbi:MAG: amidohydrolase [Fluviicola sp.]|nr:amidohydrolase [Fluviicola sp.]
MNREIENIIRQKSEELFAKVKGIREHIHAHPELSYEEFETMNYVSQQLTAIGIEHSTQVGKTGLVATIRGEQHSKQDEAIALRADLDALPIQEENEVAYKSAKDGIMHACGHDVHTSVLLGAAEILHELRNELPCPVKLVFQPGEEKNPGGATYMIADGVLENPKVKKMFALHVFPDMEVGKVGFKEGIYMASCDEIYITINGKGGHGATPHQCIDPIVIGANIVTTMQQIVTRKCDPKIPCVLSFGHFEALGATNVIPSKAYLKGTFRTMNEEWRAEALQLIQKTGEDIAKASGGTADVTISKGYPYLENDAETTRGMQKMAVAFLGEEKVEDLPIRLTAEDFSYYSQLVPVCFFRLGVRNESKGITYGVHHPKFNIDDDALKIGMQMMCLAAFS